MLLIIPHETVPVGTCDVSHMLSICVAPLSLTKSSLAV